jgi:Family of unknown function (DUF6412)
MIKGMTGRRKTGAGLALILLSVVLPAVFPALGSAPGGVVPAGALVAVALLFAALATRVALVPVPIFVRARPDAAATSATLVPLRVVDPDAAGRSRPRAPGYGPAAR